MPSLLHIWDAVELFEMHKVGLALEDEELPLPSDIEVRSYHVLRNRLFTAVALEQENITYRWTEAIVNFKQTRDERIFAKRFDGIVATIVWLSTGVGHRPETPNVWDKSP